MGAWVFMWDSGAWDMQALSSRAHAFSVEALVGRSACKRSKPGEDSEEQAASKEKTRAGEQRMEKVHNQATEETGDAEPEKKKSSATGRNCEDKEVKVELQGSDLWNRFHQIGTEMIITKAGRRMFPALRVKVKNLDPFKQYHIAMDIIPVDSKRYRYVYHSSQWMVAGNTDHSCITPRLYLHPDSPACGDTWTRQVVSFDRVKLTNNEMDDKGHIILQSMHKYKPRVHVIEHEPGVDLTKGQTLPAHGVYSFSFSETQFTTVTAYQNQQITKLKIERNPFAKGFRDPGRNRGVLEGILESYPWRSPHSLDIKSFNMETQVGNLGSANCVAPSPLKSLLSSASSCSSASFPFTSHCSDPTVPNLTLPLYYKLPPSPPSGLLLTRSYASPAYERLRVFPGSDHLLKKVSKCRGQCLQGPAVGHGFTLNSLHGVGGPSLHTSALCAESLPTHLYGCGYALPVGHGVTRHAKLSHGGVTLPSGESLLPHSWPQSLNHCL